MVVESSKMSMEKTSEDLTDINWSDPQWLASFPLNDATALHYFSMSQFYDPRCNNELVNMQQLDPKLLKTMEGIEYSHTSPCPGLFVITKSYRTLKPPKLEPLAYYYIYNGRIYQAPTLHSIFSARLLQSFHHLRKTFDTIRNAASLSTQGKYTWEPSPVPPDELHVPEGYELSSGEHKAVDDLLFDIWHKNNAINEKQVEKERQLLQQQQQQQQDQKLQPQQQLQLLQRQQQQAQQKQPRQQQQQQLKQQQPQQHQTQSQPQPQQTQQQQKQQQHLQQKSKQPQQEQHMSQQQQPPPPPPPPQSQLKQQQKQQQQHQNLSQSTQHLHNQQTPGSDGKHGSGGALSSGVQGGSR